MTQYRKAGMRLYYKVMDNGIVVRVRNQDKLSQVDVSINPIIQCEAMDDTKEVTQAEFDEQLDIAMGRINELRL